MDKIIERIGLPALLEMLAEECTELAHACLKLARVLRKENPTPKTKHECLVELTEEIADVWLCIDSISDIVDIDVVDIIYLRKKARWKERILAQEEEDD